MESEPLFPTTRPEEVDAVNGVPQMEMVTYSGLTKREWFAGQCDVSVYKPLDTFVTAYGKKPTIDELAAYIANIRRIEADALIAALETKT